VAIKDQRKLKAEYHGLKRKGIREKETRKLHPEPPKLRTGRSAT